MKLPTMKYDPQLFDEAESFANERAAAALMEKLPFRPVERDGNIGVKSERQLLLEFNGSTLSVLSNPWNIGSGFEVMLRDKKGNPLSPDRSKTGHEFMDGVTTVKPQELVDLIHAVGALDINKGRNQGMGGGFGGPSRTGL